MLKETGFLFLPAIIFYRIIFKHKNIIPVLVSGTAAFLLYLAIRFGIGNADTDRANFAPMYTLPLIDRMLNIPAIIFYYLKILVYPANLAIWQEWIVDKVNFSQFYYPLLIDLIFFSAISLVGFFIRVNKKLFLTFIFFVLIFLMGLSLYLQIIPLDFTVSDRWFYFPFVGLLGILGVACSLIKLHNRKYRIFLYAVGSLIILSLSIRTIVRNTNWADNLTLYSHDVKIADNYKLEINLSDEYFSRGNDKEYLYHINKSIKLFPNEFNITNLGHFYLANGNIKKAQQYFLKALTYNVYPQKGHRQIMAEIYQGLAGTYILSGQFEQAKIFIETLLPKYSTDSILWECLAISEYNLHNKQKALVAAEKAKNLLQNVDTNYIYNQILNNQTIKFRVVH